jgi:hypothetical protein
VPTSELSVLNSELNTLLDKYHALAAKGNRHSRYEMILHVCNLLAEAGDAGRRIVLLIDLQERSMENDDQAKG